MATRLSPLEPKRLYQQIAGVLRASIDDGTFPVGGFLPPERELAEQLGVSRASVREALIALEVQGRVSVRVGAGVLVLPGAVTAPSPAAIAQSEPPIGPLDLLEARLVVETESAALAAIHATASDLRELKRAMTRMVRDTQRGSTRHEGDRAFHLAVAQASGNAALSYLVTKLWDRRPTPIQERLETLLGTPERFSAAVADHEVILKSIASRDAAGARDAMRRHLVRVRDSLSRAIDRSD